MNILKAILEIGIALALSMLFLLAATGAGIGISSGNIVLTGMRPDTTYSRDVLVSTDSIEPMTVTVTLEGEAGEWTKADSSIIVSRGKPASLPVTVTVPEGTAPGKYEGRIVFTSDPPANEGGGVGIGTGVLSLISVDVISSESPRCRVDGMVVENRVDGLEISFSLSNLGSLALDPVLVVRTTLDGSVREESFPLGRAAPEKKTSHTVIWDTHTTGISRIEAIVEECRYREEHGLSFSTTRTLGSEGVFVSLEVGKEAQTDAQVPITAVFRNEGDRALDVRFVGRAIPEVDSDIRFSSEELLVGSGEEMQFTVYLFLEETGTYEIESKFIYEDKESIERGSSISVIGDEESQFDVSNGQILALAGAVIIMTILGVFFMGYLRKKAK